MGAERDDDQVDLAEVLERLFESVAYHGLKRGVKRFTGELSGPRPPAPQAADSDKDDAPSFQARRAPADGAYDRPALPPRAEGQLPAPLIRRRGRLPKQREHQSDGVSPDHRGPAPDEAGSPDREVLDEGDTEP
jgi:hypothetical protein